MKNIHITPTDESLKKRGDLVQDKFGTIHIFTINDGEEYGKTTTKLHIYITSDEEIKEGDWALMFDDFGNLFLCDKPQQYLGIEKGHHLNKGLRKIILTTDPTLIADGVQEINNEFLEWFMKNDTCEFVEVTKLDYLSNNQYRIYELSQEEPKSQIEYTNTDDFTSIIYNPQEEPKKCENCNQIIDKYGCACPKDSKQEQRQHLIDMVKLDEELGLYDESKQETLEEAAEKYSKRHQDVSGTLGKYLVSAVFQDGAKWQAERSYSETEVLQLLLRLQQTESYDNLYDWFEQFKKK